MEIEHVATFLKVVDTGCNLTAAAKKLHKSQPTVTRLMKELERSLGGDVPLFEKRGRNKFLTPYGKKLAELLTPVKASWDDIPKRLRDEAESETLDPVSIGAGMTAARYLLPGPIRRFGKKRKDVPISLRVELWPETLKGLRSGELDFGLRSSTEVPQDMRFWLIKSYSSRLIAPQKHPINVGPDLDPQALSAHAFVAPSVDTRGWNTIREYFGVQGLDCRLAMTVGGWELVKLYVKMGVGPAIVPDFCLTPEDQGQLAVHPGPKGYPQLHYGVIYKTGAYFSRTARDLIQEIAPGFRKGINRLRMP